jgi:hypothetical protein
MLVPIKAKLMKRQAFYKLSMCFGLERRERGIAQAFIGRPITAGDAF